MIRPDVLGDAVVSWLGGLGALSLWWHLRRSESASLQQRRARLLLAALAALLLVRGFFWLLPPDPRLFKLTFVPATLVPLGAALFVEGLLRRHLPLALKVLATGGSALFLVLDLAGVLRRGSDWVLAFAAYEVVLLAALGWLVLRRDRAGLSPAENRFVERLWVALLFAIPLAATDFRHALGWPPARLGALGALIFAYALVRGGSRAERRGTLLREVLRLAARAAVLAAALAAVLGFDAGRAWHLAAAACGFVLLAALWQRLADVRAEVEQGSFLAWWGGADVSSLDRFVAALESCPVAESCLLVAGPALEGYDEPALAARLRAAPVASLTALQESPRADAGDHRFAEEQLADLLARHGMEHACLVRARPLALLLVGHAPLGGSPATELEIALLQKSAAMLAAREAELA